MRVPRPLITLLSRFFTILMPLFFVACSSEENIGAAGSLGAQGATGSLQIALSWLPPVEREDGTPISMTEIAGYRVYYGTTQGDYNENIEIAGSDTMQAEVGGLTAGTYYLVVTTYDVDGVESDYSQMVTKRI